MYAAKLIKHLLYFLYNIYSLVPVSADSASAISVFRGLPRAEKMEN
jgi:hypothetical protein